MTETCDSLLQLSFFGFPRLTLESVLLNSVAAGACIVAWQKDEYLLSYTLCFLIGYSIYLERNCFLGTKERPPEAAVIGLPACLLSAPILLTTSHLFAVASKGNGFGDEPLVEVSHASVVVFLVLFYFVLSVLYVLRTECRRIFASISLLVSIIGWMFNHSTLQLTKSWCDLTFSIGVALLGHSIMLQISSYVYTFADEFCAYRISREVGFLFNVFAVLYTNHFLLDSYATEIRDEHKILFATYCIALYGLSPTSKKRTRTLRRHYLALASAIAFIYMFFLVKFGKNLYKNWISAAFLFHFLAGCIFLALVLYITYPVQGFSLHAKHQPKKSNAQCFLRIGCTQKIIARKVFHYFFVFLTFWAFYFEYSTQICLYILELITIAAFFVELLRSKLSIKWKLRQLIDRYYHAYADERDRGIIRSHIYLLLGVTLPFLSSTYPVIQSKADTIKDSRCLLAPPYIGILALGVVDSTAAVAGSIWGTHKWNDLFGLRHTQHTYLSAKTIEGSIAALVISTLVEVFFRSGLGYPTSLSDTLHIAFNISPLCVAEAMIDSSDNLLLPFFAMILEQLKSMC